MSDTGQALALIDQLYRLSRSLLGDVRSHVEGVAGLDMGDFVLLRAVSSGITSPGALATEMRSHPAVISRTITHLAKAGLLERSPDPTDSRRLVIGLTDHGRDVTESVAARIRPGLQRRLDTLDDGEADRLLAALAHLLASEPPA